MEDVSDGQKYPGITQKRKKIAKSANCMKLEDSRPIINLKLFRMMNRKTSNSSWTKKIHTTKLAKKKPRKLAARNNPNKLNKG